MKSFTLSRRRFLGLGSATAAGLMICPDLWARKNNKPLLRFGMLSDVHYADREPSLDRYYRQSLAKLKECIDLMNRQKVDFVIELGDFKDQDVEPDEAKTLKYLSDIESVFQQFKGPTYHALGNHDMDSISKQQFLTRVVNTQIPTSQSYYSFNHNGFHFVVLDGNFTKEGKDYDHGNFTWDEALIPDQELKWLEEDFKSNHLPVVVFIHQMLDDSKSQAHSVQNAGQVRQIIEQSGRVLCVFQGHVHEERYNLINNIHYYSIMAMADHSGMENNSYVIVELYKDGSLVVEGYRRASDRTFIKS